MEEKLIESCQKLLNDFAKIPKREFEESFISICGFPHREVVASNILAFFFDTSREHHLKDLFVKSLFSVAKLDSSKCQGKFCVETEVQTEKGNRIDIMLYGDDVNIIIENKIYAWLYNDLDDYYNSASKNGKETKGVVLSFNSIPESERKNKESFAYITYADFFVEVKKNLGFYVQDANQKYIPFLMDFINNIENLKGGRPMDMEFVKLVKGNMNQAVEFEQEIQKLRNYIRNTVNHVNALVLNDKRTEKYKSTNNFWRYNEPPALFETLVFEYSSKGLYVDSVLDLDGWHFYLGKRSESNIGLESCVEGLGLSGSYENENRFKIETEFPLNNTNESDVVNFIADLVNSIVAKI